MPDKLTHVSWRSRLSVGCLQRRSQKSRGPRYSNRRNGIIREEDAGEDSDGYPSQAEDSDEVQRLIFTICSFMTKFRKQGVRDHMLCAHWCTHGARHVCAVKRGRVPFLF